MGLTLCTSAQAGPNDPLPWRTWRSSSTWTASSRSPCGSSPQCPYSPGHSVTTSSLVSIKHTSSAVLRGGGRMMTVCCCYGNTGQACGCFRLFACRGCCFLGSAFTLRHLHVLSDGKENVQNWGSWLKKTNKDTNCIDLKYGSDMRIFHGSC